MKLTSESFGNYYITHDHQSTRVHAKDDNKMIEKFTTPRRLSDATVAIVKLRLSDECSDEMDIRDYVQLEQKIREDIRKIFDPTGELMERLRENQRQAELQQVQG